MGFIYREDILLESLQRQGGNLTSRSKTGLGDIRRDRRLVGAFGCHAMIRRRRRRVELRLNAWHPFFPEVEAKIEGTAAREVVPFPTLENQRRAATPPRRV